MYPKGTNHFSPYSALFKKEQRKCTRFSALPNGAHSDVVLTGLGIFMSDVGLIGMMSLLYLFARTYGWSAFVMYYFVPYVVSSLPEPVIRDTDSTLPQLCNHWYAPSAF